MQSGKSGIFLLNSVNLFFWKGCCMYVEKFESIVLVTVRDWKCVNCEEFWFIDEQHIGTMTSYFSLTPVFYGGSLNFICTFSLFPLIFFFLLTKGIKLYSNLSPVVMFFVRVISPFSSLILTFFLIKINFPKKMHV